MKFSFLSVAWLLISSLSLLAADPKYPVKLIPESLRENADAVFREDHSTFTIHSRNKASHHVHQVITILHPNGKYMAEEAVMYDKHRTIAYLKATVYDANGIVIKKLKNSDIIDRSAVSGISLYEDNRVKIIDLRQNTYPYTIEIEYQVDWKFLYSIPGFIVSASEKITSQRASYTLVYPKELKPRYKVSNTDVQPQEKLSSDGKESLTWTFSNYRLAKREPYGPPLSERAVRVIAAPSAFEFDGYAGTMDTWQNFGKWQASLNKNRNILPEATKRKVAELTNGLSPEEKVRVLYQYLQNKTRYVSIQLGIGGLQPFEAKLVDQTSYGDCKALSNYMVALLAEAGIKGHYAVIYGGDNPPPVYDNFVYDAFNHVVVAVPMKSDTIWLECTSQTNPFGYAGSFIGNRRAMLVTDEGGVLANTPVYHEGLNIQSRKAWVDINSNGDAKATIETTLQGLQYENGGLNFILNNQYDRQREWVQNNTQIPAFDINKFSFEEKKDKVPSAKVRLDLTLNRLASVSGKRIFLTPNLMNRISSIPEKVNNRQTDVILPLAYTDYDTIHYNVPESIFPEFLPEPVRYSCRFGEYESSYKLDAGVVVYTRKMVAKGGRFPAESYNELVEFYKNISKADNTKIVFLTKT